MSKFPLCSERRVRDPAESAAHKGTVRKATVKYNPASQNHLARRKEGSGEPLEQSLPVPERAPARQLGKEFLHGLGVMGCEGMD